MIPVRKFLLPNVADMKPPSSTKEAIQMLELARKLVNVGSQKAKLPSESRNVMNLAMTALSHSLGSETASGSTSSPQSSRQERSDLGRRRDDSGSDRSYDDVRRRDYRDDYEARRSRSRSHNSWSEDDRYGVKRERSGSHDNSPRDRHGSQVRSPSHQKDYPREKERRTSDYRRYRS